MSTFLARFVIFLIKCYLVEFSIDWKCCRTCRALISTYLLHQSLMFLPDFVASHRCLTAILSRNESRHCSQKQQVHVALQGLSSELISVKTPSHRLCAYRLQQRFIFSVLRYSFYPVISGHRRITDKSIWFFHFSLEQSIINIKSYLCCVK